MPRIKYRKKDTLRLTSKGTTLYKKTPGKYPGKLHRRKRK